MGRKSNVTTRIPVNDEYAAIIGKAIYMFSYYEWTLIYIIDSLTDGFVRRYSRHSGRPLTSGAVKREMDHEIEKSKHTILPVEMEELEACSHIFGELIHKRNALIHAHPIIDNDGSQILSYQSNRSRPISFMKWPVQQVEEFISEIDNAAVTANAILFKLRHVN